MKNLQYRAFKIQNYFYRTDITNDQKKIIFKFRTRMADFGENYRGARDQVNCPLCDTHRDKQELSYTCKVIQNEVQPKGEFEDTGCPKKNATYFQGFCMKFDVKVSWFWILPEIGYTIWK